MPTLIIEEDGMYACQRCGGGSFVSKVNVMKCFHCEQCSAFQRDGLKIIDKRELKKQKNLNFFKTV